MGARTFVVRHWETGNNRDDILQGSGDSGPSERGLRQAEAASRALSGVEFGVHWSGPQDRHLGTLGAITGPFAPTKIETGLREQHMGVWEGRHIADLLRDHGDLFRLWRDGDGVPKEGEAFRDVEERVLASWERIAGNAIKFGHDALVVSSGTPIRMILGAVLGIPLRSLKAITVDNCSITVLRWMDGGYWQVERMNDTHHLREVGVNKTFV